MPDKSPERCERCGDPVCPFMPPMDTLLNLDRAMEICNQNRIAKSLAEIADSLNYISEKGNL